MSNQTNEVESLVDDIRDYWDPWDNGPERLAEALLDKGWRKLNLPTDAERKAAARIRVTADKKTWCYHPGLD